MEKTINQRLKEYIEVKKINPPEIYSGTKISRQLWSNFINTSSSIPSEKLGILINKMPELNARWLLTGEGSMIVEYEQTDRQYTSQDKPQPPKHTRYCNDPVCNARILELETQVNILISHIGSLNRREDPTEKNDSGGVEKTRRQYPGKTG